jgi:ribose transport system permease protein
MPDTVQPAMGTPTRAGLRANGPAVLFVLLAILCLAISLGSPRFYAAENIAGILRQCALVLIIGSGMTFLLIAAEVDLSVGAALAFAGVVAMDVTNQTGSALLGALAGILFGGFVGLVNGIIVTRLKVKSLIATIATMMVLQGSVFLYSRQAIQNRDQLPAFSAISTGYLGPVPMPVLIAAVTFACAYVVLRHTLFGRYIYAVGANPRAARLSGLDPDRLKLFLFIITGLLTGLSGLVLASLMNAGQPTAGRGFELTVIAAVILGGTSLKGGRGTLLGTLLGVLILQVINNGIIILGWDQELQLVVPGFVIVLAAYLDIVRRRADVR